MHSSLKNTIFSVICLVLIMSSVALAQGESSGIVFPEVSGWEKGEITTYPQQELGYSIYYKSEDGGTVTIYVYNGGVKTIADGIDDEIIRDQIKSAESEIKKYGELGYYKNVKLIKSETVTLGGNSGTTKALYSLFAFKYQGSEVDSEIYLFGYKNNFIKIRATRSKGEYSADNDAVHSLLKEIGKLFVK